VAQVVKRLPSNHEALSSNPSTLKKQTNKQTNNTLTQLFVGMSHLHLAPYLGLFICLDRVPLCSPGWPQTLDSPAQSPKYWDYRCILHHLTKSVILILLILTSYYFSSMLTIYHYFLK
jgi:hypothetical protein